MSLYPGGSYPSFEPKRLTTECWGTLTKTPFKGTTRILLFGPCLSIKQSKTSGSTLCHALRLNSPTLVPALPMLQKQPDMTFCMVWGGLVILRGHNLRQ